MTSWFRQLDPEMRIEIVDSHRDPSLMLLAVCEAETLLDALKLLLGQEPDQARVEKEDEAKSPAPGKSEP